MKIEYLVDIVPRDVPPGIELRNGLDRNGECLISSTFVADGDKRWTLLMSLRFGADIFVTPWYNSRRTLELFARANLGGSQLVHFPSEQFFSPFFDAEKLNTNCAAEYRRDVAAVFVWGEYYAKRLVEDVSFPRDRIFEVGNPRLWTKPVGVEVGAGSERRGGKTRILFVSDFTLADMDSESKRTAFSKAYEVDVTKEDVSEVAAERQYMLETARRIADAADCEVLVRPHPGEEVELYRQLGRDSNAGFADPSEHFMKHVGWSDVVIGYTSTSVFDVVATDRPFLALRRKAPPRIVTREALEPLYESCSADELIAILNDSKRLRRAKSKVTAKAEFFMGNISGEFDPYAALGAALVATHALSRGRGASSREFLKVARGSVRSGIKYLAFRILASGAWRFLKGWQPAAVRQRIAPGCNVSEEVIRRYSWDVEHGGSAARGVAKGSGKSLRWKLDRWCWRPFYVESSDEKAG